MSDIENTRQFLLAEADMIVRQAKQRLDPIRDKLIELNALQSPLPFVLASEFFSVDNKPSHWHTAALSSHHDLKVNPQFWPSLVDGSKNFEIRRNDRKFAVGDICCFKEFNPSHGYTGEGPLIKRISYVLHHEDFPAGVPVGFVALGFGE